MSSPLSYSSPQSAPPPRREAIPWRTIAAAILLVVLTYVGFQLIVAMERILTWTAISIFFAVALYPLVNLVDRLVGGRRWLATLLVFLGALVMLAGLVAVFVVPLAREATDLVDKAPGYWSDARNGEGAIGRLVREYNIDEYYERNEARIREGLSGLSAPALHILGTAAEGVAGILTIFVLSYLLVLEGPKIVDGILAMFSDDRRRDRVAKVGADCGQTVTGYVTGMLLIAAVCGLSTFIILAILGVPYAGLIALFVALCDLVPLVGATLGAVVASVAGFLDSVTSGIVVVIFFVIYQQVENHLFQPIVQSRTVKMNPLTVILAILVGVELAGILGALLGIPIAGVIQVIIRDVWDHRRGALKDQPTVGEGPDKQPVDSAPRPGKDSLPGGSGQGSSPLGGLSAHQPG